jgi:Peptidase family M49
VLILTLVVREGEVAKITGYVLVGVLVGMLSIPAAARKRSGNAAPDLARLDKMADRFTPVQIRVDISGLSSGDRQALIKSIEAGRILNDIFLQQLWSGNEALYAKLQKDHSALGKARLHYFWLNKGPWSSLDGNIAFLPDVPPRKPLGANFYPEDMSKDDFESWVASLPEKDQEQAKGFFTVIRWTDAGAGGHKLRMVPYSEEYKDELTRAAGLLHEAADATDNDSLRKFLNLRADAFLSNDYYQSDLAWMDLDAPLDITIGPYETYNDELYGYKAAFEAYVTLRDEDATTKLSAFTQHLQEIEDHLPIDPQYRNPKLGAAAPIRVVDEILSSGDGDHGVQTAAYNLPNDDRVVQQKGSKRVMLKNIQEAKFRSILLPIARRLLSKPAMIDVSFDSFFTHILAHELMHGLGPHQIKVQGKDTTPREELKELYAPIEEAKADVTGLFALQYMMDHAREMGVSKVLASDDAAQRQLYTTYLASAFRSLRFGLHEAHGKGMAMQFNFLMDQGAFVRNDDGTYRVDMEKIRPAVTQLDHDLLTIEAEGDYAGAKKMLDDLGVIRPALQKSLDSLRDVPTDIEPVFVTADELVPVAKQEAAPKPAHKKRRSRRK